MSDNLRGHLMIFGAAALWGTLGVFGRSLQAGGMDPLEMTFWRAFWAFILLGGVLALTAPRLLRVPRRELLPLALYGVATVPIFELIYFTSISLNPIGLAAVLLYTAPVYVLVLAVPFLGESLDRFKAAALLLALTGCFLVVAPGGSLGAGITVKGVLFGLASGFAYALVSLLGKRFSLQTNHWTLTFYSMAFGTLAMLPLTYFNFGRVGVYSSETWAYGIGLGLIPTLLSYGLFFGGLRLIDASSASITATIEPVVAALLGYFLFGETMILGQYLGAALVLGAVLWLNLGPKLTRREARATMEQYREE